MLAGHRFWVRSCMVTCIFKYKKLRCDSVVVVADNDNGDDDREDTGYLYSEAISL